MPMSANDQFFPRPEGLPPDDDLAPLVLPVDRSAEAPLVLPVDGSDIPTVLPAPKPPHPGFWWSVFYTFVIVFGVNICVVVVCAIVLVVLAVASGNPRDYFAQFRS